MRQRVSLPSRSLRLPHLATLVPAVLLFVPLVAAQQPPALEELRARVAAQPASGPDWFALGRALQDAEQYLADLGLEKR